MDCCIYENGKIFTSDRENLYADAMLVTDGIIRRVGCAADIENMAPKGCRRVDLGGRRVIPGFVDAHMHPLMLADYSRQISALPPKVNSIEELIQAVKEQRQKQGPDQWCLGWGYDEGKFAEHRSINRWDLDQGCSDAPVSIIRTCGHIRCVNSKALELAGIDRNTPDPEGGEIERDANGEPTGVLKENARNLITPLMPVPDSRQTVKNLTQLGKLLTSQGIVAVTDMGNLDEGDNYPIYEAAVKQGFLQQVGVYYMWDFFMDQEDFSIPKERFDKNQQIFVSGLKLIGDGSVSGKTAWMAEPYLDTDSCGISVCSDRQMETAIDFCKTYHCQLAIHAMGTKAIDRAVSRAAAEEKWNSGPEPYVRVEHITLPSQESIDLAVQKGIGFVTQPIFMYAEIESYMKNLGKARMKQCYPVRHMLDCGVNLCFSTDAPATSWAVPSDPFSNIKAAVTRRAYDGTDCGGSQVVDVETAVILYTKAAAKMVGFEKIGQIKEGYKADFLVLDKDMMEIPAGEIDRVHVAETYIGGRCVYRRKP